jgi:hypothetical protein
VVGGGPPPQVKSSALLSLYYLAQLLSLNPSLRKVKLRAPEDEAVVDLLDPIRHSSINPT